MTIDLRFLINFADASEVSHEPQGVHSPDLQKRYIYLLSSDKCFSIRLSGNQC